MSEDTRQEIWYFEGSYYVRDDDLGIYQSMNSEESARDYLNVIKERDALQAKLTVAEHMAFDYRNERDAYMQSYDGVCKERDALGKKVNLAIDTLNFLRYGEIEDVDSFIDEALTKLWEEK